MDARVQQDSRARPRRGRRLLVGVAAAALLHAALALMIARMRPPGGPLVYDTLSIELLAPGLSDGPPGRPAERVVSTAPPEAAAPATETEPVPSEPPPPSEAEPEPPPVAAEAPVDPTPPSDAEAQVRALIGEAATAAEAPAASADASALSQPGASGVCEASGYVASALMKDAKLLDALSALPVDALSVAGAIPLWNGEWVETDQAVAGPTVAALRAAVAGVAVTLPPDCLAAPLIGPRFMILPTQTRTVVVVVGAASWRWQDLKIADPETPASKGDA